MKITQSMIDNVTNETLTKLAITQIIQHYHKTKQYHFIQNHKELENILKNYKLYGQSLKEYPEINKKITNITPSLDLVYINIKAEDQIRNIQKQGAL